MLDPPPCAPSPSFTPNLAGQPAQGDHQQPPLHGLGRLGQLRGLHGPPGQQALQGSKEVSDGQC